MLRCADGSLYTGIAKDLARRLERHRRGKASKYTVSEPKYGFNVDLHDHNAVQGSFAFEA